MNYWLIKSEPSEYSWDQFVKDKKTAWTGIRSFAARNHLRAMKLGDLAFFYHSNEGKDIIGIAKVIKEAYPDSTDEKFSVVDFAPVKPLKNPVSLDDIKGEKKLQDMKLLKISRLSVSPVTKEEWNLIIKMSTENSVT